MLRPRPAHPSLVELASGPGSAWSWSLPSSSAGLAPAPRHDLDGGPGAPISSWSTTCVVGWCSGPGVVPRPLFCDAHGFDYGSSAGSLPLCERCYRRWVGVTRCRASVEPKVAPACSVGASGCSPKAPTELETVPSKHSR
jgi:hypothetical protein